MEEKKELGFWSRFIENHPVLTAVTFLVVFNELMDLLIDFRDRNRYK